MVRRRSRSSCVRATSFALFLTFAVVPWIGEVFAQSTPEPALDRDAVPVVGRHAIDVEIPEFGRWALFAESERGVALQVVDRAAGPGPIVGAAGEEDGRIDTFLDRGDVRLVAHGLDPASLPEGASISGEARLRVVPFREIGSEAVRLGDLSLVTTSLRDFEVRSWWIELDSPQRVVLEAAGRHLADLRLWRDGAWLVGVEPGVDVVEPEEGRPLRRARLATRLDAGLYRLSAYGGPGVDWANEGANEGTEAAAPLYLRSGIPRAGEAGRRRVEISPFGEDRVLVPGTATFFRVETGPEGPGGDSGVSEVTLEVGDFVPEAPFEPRSTQSVTITKKTNPPAVELTRGLRPNQLRLVTVRGRAGEAVTLQHFLARPVYNFSESGRYWLSTTSSGTPGDALDTTAILVRNQAGPEHRRAIETRAVDLVDGLEWRRRFNLLDGATLHLRVVDPGSYSIGTSGEARVGLRLEPFALPGTRPDGYRPPDFRDGAGEWQLDAGLYLLTLEPRRKGIAELWIRDPAPSADLGSTDASTAAPVSADVRFGIVDLDANDTYTLYVNERPGVETGIVLRKAPLDLAEPLPLVLDADESVVVPTRPGEGGRFVVTAESGAISELSRATDGTLRVTRPEESGDGPVAQPVALSVEFIGDERRGELPTLPADRIAAIPAFPVLEPGAEARLDLGRNGRATYRLAADAPGLYRLESTGLLDTRGALRTRTTPVLEASADGGAGRNFSIGRYLGPGDYQLTVATVGRSAGPLGLRLARTAVRDGGVLVPGSGSRGVARGWLEAGEAVAYRVRVDEPGRYRLRSLGLGEPFRVRLEDAEGWPLVEPGVVGDLETRLEAGEYRWIVLPRPVRARQVTLVERIPEPVERSGRGSVDHGPFDLAFDEPVTHVWREPASEAASEAASQDGERAPDVWRFELPASARVRIELSPEMEADLLRVDPDDDSTEPDSTEPVAEIAPRREFFERLEAGEYELHVVAARVDDRREYSLRVAPEELLAGQEREVVLPVDGAVEMPISIGGDEPGLHEITTLGTVDARATLVDASGEVVARADDRPGDWNVRLARRLAPGEYRLRLDAVDGDGETRVALRRVMEALVPAFDLELAEPIEEIYALDAAAIVPIGWPAGADALLVDARSTGNLRVVVETESGPVGERDGVAPSLLVPLDGSGGDLHLRLEALDGVGQEVTLRVAAFDLDAVSEATLESSGGRLAPRLAEGFDAAPVVIDLDRAGCFRVEGAEVATRPGVVATSVPPSAVVSAARRLWLAVGSEGARVERATVDSKGLRLLVEAGQTAACDLGAVGSEAGDSSRKLVIARGLGASAAVAPAGGTPAGLAPATDDPARWWTDVLDEDARPFPLGFANRGVAGDASAFFATADAAVVRVDSEGGAESGGWIEVDLEAHDRPEISSASADYGTSSFEVPADGALVVELPSDRPLRLAIDLSRGGLAVVGERAVWASDAARSVRLDAVGPLYVVDTEGTGVHASVEVLPRSDKGLFGVQPSQPLEIRATTSGTFDVPVSSLGGSTLALGVRDLRVIGHDGSLSRGLDAVDFGRLVVEHGPGPVVVWPFDPNQPLAAFWPASPPPIEALDLPASIDLGGAGRLFTIHAAAPRVLHLRAPGAVLVGVERPDRAPRLDGFVEGFALDLPLPAGATRVSLRSIGESELAGRLEAWTSEVVPLGEGLGPEILLGPGDAHYFSITVPDGEPRRVGFGVSAEADVVEGRVVASTGRELGRGVVQWHELPPGTHLFALELARDAEPVRARPAIVGLERPGTGPPPEVAAEYLRRSSGSSSAGQPGARE